MRNFILAAFLAVVSSAALASGYSSGSVSNSAGVRSATGSVAISSGNGSAYSIGSAEQSAVSYGSVNRGRNSVGLEGYAATSGSTYNYSQATGNALTGSGSVAGGYATFEGRGGVRNHDGYGRAGIRGGVAGGNKSYTGAAYRGRAEAGGGNGAEAGAGAGVRVNGDGVSVETDTVSAAGVGTYESAYGLAIAGSRGGAIGGAKAKAYGSTGDDD